MAETWGPYLSIPGLSVNADLSTYQYHFVKRASTAGTIKNLGATTDSVIGVLLNDPDAAGEAAIVVNAGTVLVKSGTSVITAGALVTPNSTGRAITGGVRAYGRAIETPTTSGDLIRISLLPGT